MKTQLRGRGPGGGRASSHGASHGNDLKTHNKPSPMCGDASKRHAVVLACLMHMIAHVRQCGASAAEAASGMRLFLTLAKTIL